MSFHPRRKHPRLDTSVGGGMYPSKLLASAGGRPVSLLLHRLKHLFADHARPELPWSATLPSPAAAPIFARPLVLVVDDNPVNLMVASEMLSYCGIKPLLASDGAEAFAIACERRLDLILMDLTMPVLDGFDATALIRRFERENGHPRVPVVAYTATLVSNDKPRLRECGIDAVLEKPVDVHAFQACVMRWCSPPESSDAPVPFGALHQRVGHARSSITSA
jgi:CheY-like chemotaxis protein